MPLMAKLPAGMAEHDPATVQVHLEAEDQKKVDLTKDGSEQDSGYEDFDAFEHQEPVDSDMEGSILDRPRPKKAAKAPVVPQRSDKRASKILENVLLELQSLDGSLSAKEAEQQSIVSDPHELYLSSEEDASLSDDYEDSESLVDFEASPVEDGQESKPSSRASSRRSQEDTARVVSFTLVTKPQIVQIDIPPTAAQRRHSMNLEALTASLSQANVNANADAIPKSRRPTPLKLYPSSLRRMSISSTTTMSSILNPTLNSRTLTHHHSNASLTSLSLPPRKSSKLANLTSIVTRGAKNSFLATDPFASPSVFTPPDSAEAYADADAEEQETPKSPWRKSLSRTMSKARKPSVSKLSAAYAQRDLRLARELAHEEVMELERERERSAPVSPASPVPAPVPARERERGERERKMSISLSGKMAGLGMGRKKSVKAGRERAG